jgi:signal transduction histidine kinase
VESVPVVDDGRLRVSIDSLLEGVQVIGFDWTYLYLNSFTRQQILTVEPVDLNAVIRDLEQFVRRIIGEDLTVDTRLAGDLWTIESDRTQIEQVVMNLLVNARDAMPDGGTLTVDTTDAELAEAYVESHPNVTPGPHVVLTVADTGTGMSEETRTRIFEPFFTTKEKGTGLGLRRVLFMSGYTGSRDLRIAPGEVGGLVQKPFTGTELLRRVRAALDGPG